MTHKINRKKKQINKTHQSETTESHHKKNKPNNKSTAPANLGCKDIVLDIIMYLDINIKPQKLQL